MLLGNNFYFNCIFREAFFDEAWHPFLILFMILKYIVELMKVSLSFSRKDVLWQWGKSLEYLIIFDRLGLFHILLNYIQLANKCTHHYYDDFFYHFLACIVCDI